LVALTVGVLAVHLLALGPSLMQQAPRQGARPFVTRMVTAQAPQQVARAPIQQPAVEERKPAPPRPPRPAVTPAPTAAAPVSEPVAAAPVEPASAAASAPASVVETSPAPDAASASAGAVPLAPETAFAFPGSVHLRYAVTGRSRGRAWNGDGELLWRQDGEQYEARQEYSSPLQPSPRAQESTGRLRSEGLTPSRFSDKARGEQATHFERDTSKLLFSNNAPERPLLPGTQDRLSVYLQLASMLAAAPDKFPIGTAITLETAGTRDSEPWQFVVQEDETLQLPGGSVATRKLVRDPRGEYDTRVELWLATGMDYVPVRIRLTQPNGDFVDQQWASTDRP
jgi:hypothetical protein